MTVRPHLFPFRTQKLSSLVPKIVGWTRPVKIGRCRLLSSIRLLKPQPDGHAPLAQLVEQLTLNQWAQGSSPWRCTNKKTQDRKILRLFFLSAELQRDHLKWVSPVLWSIFNSSGNFRWTSAEQEKPTSSSGYSAGSLRINKAIPSLQSNWIGAFLAATARKYILCFMD